MNQIITVGHLVDMAKQRTISPIFEKAWKARTGRNPIVDALRALNVVLEDTEMARERKSHVLILTLSTFGFLFLLAPVYFYEKGESWLVMPGIIVAIFCMMLASLSAFRFIGNRLYSAELKPVDTSDAQDFCKDLNALVEWSGDNRDWDSLGLLNEDDEYLKGIAKKIIVDAAVDVLRFQNSPPKEEEQKTLFVAELAELRNKLTLRYDTLKRLGLLTEAGYERYFVLARKQLKEIEKQAA